MPKKLTKLQLAQQKAEAAVKKTNQKINELGGYTHKLYISLTTIQALFDRIRNVPEENKLKYEKLKTIQINWKQQAEKIELEYKKAEVKAAGQGAAVVVASTGTAISALSSTAATNAALVWLLCGGNITAGSAFLAMAGPVGWTIAGISIISSGLSFLKSKSEKERLENIYTLISNRDSKTYELAIVELNERIKRIVDETEKLNEAIIRIKTFGTDYSKMTEKQQYELGAYVNFMEAATMLLVNPILGLQPKFSEQFFDKLCESATEEFSHYLKTHRNMVISMANLLYKIPLDEKDKKVLAKSLRKNKDFLSSIQMTKKEFDDEDIEIIEKVLSFRYKLQAY